MSDMVKTVGAALAVSALTTLGGMVLSQGTVQRLLEDNIAVTRELTRTVTDLRLLIAEKYVTKEEFERRLKDRPRAVTLAGEM